MLAGMGAGAITGVAGGLLAGVGSLLAKKKKYQPPEYVAPDFSKVSKDQAKSNLEVLPSQLEAESKANIFRTEDLKKMLESATPGLSNLASKATQALTSMVSGQLTQGEEQMLSQKSAAWGAGAGLSGSGMAMNERLFGYSNKMQERIQQGISSSMQWIQTSRNAMTPGMADYSGMFQTTATQARSEALTVSQLKYASDIERAKAATEPSGWKAALGGMLQTMGGAMAGGGAQSMANAQANNQVSDLYAQGAISQGMPAHSAGMTIIPTGGYSSWGGF